MPHAIWEHTRQVNLDGSFYVVQGECSQASGCVGGTIVFHVAVANQMKSQVPQGGSIIGLASISALVGGEFQWFAFDPGWLNDNSIITFVVITRPQKLASCR